MVSASWFMNDIMKCDSLINQFKNYTRLLRFPFLKEGNTLGKRDSLRGFMKQNNYQNGYVSIDASDWYIDKRMTEYLQKKSEFVILGKYKDFYQSHIMSRAMFYDSLSTELTGRKIKHVLLLHHLLINALFLDDLIKMFIQSGWKIINIDDAYHDKFYSTWADIVPCGESLVWAKAKESGKYENVLRYPAEDSDYEKAAMDSLGL